MTAPNKNEGLIARLEQVEHSYPGLPDVMRNPDGPEAARAIQDLEQEVASLKEDREAAWKALSLVDSAFVKGSTLKKRNAALIECDKALQVLSGSFRG